MFDVVDTGNEAYLEFTKVDVQWQAGQVSDEVYLAALRTYANSFDRETSDWYRAQERVREAEYNIARDQLVGQINAGTKTLADLLEFDAQAMAGIEPTNQEYRTRQERLKQTTNQAAYDEFDRIRDKWQAGEVTDAAYLAAFSTYVGKLTDQTDRQAAQLQLDAARYTLARNALVTRINSGTAQIGDLLDFDNQALSSGVVPGSDEYRSRLGRLQETQRAMFSEQENDVNQRWQEGRMTTTQLLNWYREATTGNLASGNAQLLDQIANKIDSLQLRVRDERDAKVVDDFNNGRMAANAFLAYAREARDRYLPNTPDYRNWTDRINDATKRTVEDNLLYRYDLTKQYADLKRFVQTHKKAPWAGGATSEETRWVLDDQGNWVPQTRTTSTPYTPTQDQRDSWNEIQAQVAEAKVQMRYIEGQVSSVPGGWVDNQHLLNYYEGIQADYVAGSSEWYQIQQRIDSVHEAISQDNVYRTIGITVTYPWTPRDPQVVGNNPPGGGGRPPRNDNGVTQPPRTNLPAGDRPGNGPGTRHPNFPAQHGAGDEPIGNGITLDEFMIALSAGEGRGNYNARNPVTGAYGKYQMLPEYWPGRARKYLGNANAPQTPENQEAVARGMVQHLYDKFGDWRYVAAVWNVGHLPSNDPSDWSPRLQRYVNRNMRRLGSDVWTPTTLQGIYAPDDWTSGGGTPPRPDGNQPGVRPRPGGNQAPAPGPQTPSTPTAPGSSPPASPPTSGPEFLRQYTTKIGPNGRPYQAVVRTALPTWATDNPMSGSNFEDFYRDFQRGFASNSQTVTIHKPGGGTVTYSLPADAAKRQEMMAQLDNIRIDLHRNRSAAYSAAGDTDAARVADSMYNDAVHQLGENLLIGLNQAEGTSNQTGPNPLADASAYLRQTQNYIDQQTTLAQQAFDRGDYGAALAFAQRAQQRYDQAGPTLNRFLGQAEGQIAQVQSVSAAELPASVQADLDKLRNWNTQFDTKDVEDLIAQMVGDGRKQGFLQVDLVNGRPVPRLDPLTGRPILRPGNVPILGDDGRVAIKPQDPLALGADGKPLPGQQVQSGVPITVRVGNTVTTAYRDAEVDVVGTFSDGSPIYGRRVWDPLANRFVYENPFNPGHWSTSLINYTLPQGAQVHRDPTNPMDMGRSFITFQGADGRQYRMLPTGDKSGQYLVGQWDGANNTWLEGTTFTSGAADRRLVALMSGINFNRDVSLIPPDERQLADVATGPVMGMTGAEYLTWLNRNTPPPSISAPPASRLTRDESQGLAPPTPVPTQRLNAQINPNAPITGPGSFNTNYGTPPPVIPVSRYASPDAQERSRDAAPIVRPTPVITGPPIPLGANLDLDELRREQLAARRERRNKSTTPTAKTLPLPKKSKLPVIAPPPTGRAAAVRRRLEQRELLGGY